MSKKHTLFTMALILSIATYAKATNSISKQDFELIQKTMFPQENNCNVNQLIYSSKALKVSKKFTIDDGLQIIEKSTNKNILCLISMSSTPQFITKNKNIETEYSVWPKSNTEVQKIIFLLPKHIQDVCGSSPVLIEFYKKNDKLIRNIDISTTDLDCAIELTKKPLTSAK